MALTGAAAACSDPAAAPWPGYAIVVAHHANEQAPTLSTDEIAFLRAAAADPDRDDVTVEVITTGHDTAVSVDLEPRRPNGRIERGPRIDALVDERLAALQQTLTAAAADSDGGDLLRALGVAGRSGATRILVIASGVTTTDPIDLRVLGWDRDPATVADELFAQDRLPQLDGRTVTFAGFGRTAGAQAPLGEREMHHLDDLWTAVCARTDATCLIDTSLRPDAPPVSRQDLGTVSIPEVSTTAGPHGVREVSVPAPMMFKSDSCDLLDRAAAMSLLQHDVVAAVRDGSARGVQISGRTAPVGRGDGVGLATCRAEASAALLRGLGLPASAILDVRGDGSLLDPPEASHDAEGRLDPSKLPALRRVVFTLVPSVEES